MRQKIIIAIDSFKGCLTSQEANQAAAEGVTACVPDARVIQIPVSDGGEGWLAAFQAATGGALVDLSGHIGDERQARLAHRSDLAGSDRLRKAEYGRAGARPSRFDGA